MLLNFYPQPPPSFPNPTPISHSILNLHLFPKPIPQLIPPNLQPHSFPSLIPPYTCPCPQNQYTYTPPSIPRLLPKPTLPFFNLMIG